METEPKLKIGTVRQELYKSLLQTDPQSQPVEYLDILDHYEGEVLRETQETRRKSLFEKLGVEVEEK